LPDPGHEPGNEDVKQQGGDGDEKNPLEDGKLGKSSGIREQQAQGIIGKKDP
jgi:hypothetical protein